MFECSEDMLDGASANLHRVRIAVQPALHGVERVFVLSTPDPAEVGRRAVGLHRANAATVARVAVHYLSVLDSIRASPQDLDWTACRIVVFVGALSSKTKSALLKRPYALLPEVMSLRIKVCTPAPFAIERSHDPCSSPCRRSGRCP